MSVQDAVKAETPAAFWPMDELSGAVLLNAGASGSARDLALSDLGGAQSRISTPYSDIEILTEIDRRTSV